MGGFLGRLFGTDKAVSSMIEHTSNGIDKLWYTEEEKAESAQEDRSEARRMIVEWIKNTQGQNLARRLLALSIAFVWLAQYLLVQLFSIVAIWTSSETAERLVASSSVLSDNASQMDGAMMLLLGFYFAAPHLGRIVDTAMQKFGGKS